MSKPTIIVFPDLLKSHVDQYTRSDGTVVQAHDDKRMAAQVHPAVAHAVAAGAKYKSGVAAFSNAAAAHSFAAKAAGAKGGAFVMSHPEHGHHVVVNGADSQRMEKNGYKHAPLDGDKQPEPRLALPKKAAAKTGSAAPARMTNVGSEKYPLLAKNSDKLAAKHDDGSTHHVGGFEPPSNGKGDHMVHHDGKLFSFTGKSGKNMKTGEASYEYSHQSDSGDRRAWVTHSGHLMND
jgi:hypothetical protein